MPSGLPQARFWPAAVAAACCLLLAGPAQALAQAPPPPALSPALLQPAPVGAPPPPAPVAGVAGRILAGARAELGYHDHGSYCTKFGPCEVWCSLFASWVWQGAGVPIPSYPFTGSFYDWAGLNTYVLGPRSEPRPGDAVFFGSGPRTVDTSLHMGIVEDVYPDYIVTIEGDASHRVLRFVVPTRRATRIGEPGPIYGYASPLPRAGAARLRSSAVTAADARRALAALRRRRHRLSPTDLRLARSIRRWRAFQHMPYRNADVSIRWTSVERTGRIAVAVVSAQPLGFAILAWQHFLARYGDTGAAYDVSYFSP